MFPTEAWRRELSNCVVGPGCGYDVFSKSRNDDDLFSGVPNEFRDEDRACRYGDAEMFRRWPPSEAEEYVERGRESLDRLTASLSVEADGLSPALGAGFFVCAGAGCCWWW